MKDHIVMSAAALLSLLSLEDATAETRIARARVQQAATVSTSNVTHLNTPAPQPVLVGDHFGHPLN